MRSEVGDLNLLRGVLKVLGKDVIFFIFFILNVLIEYCGLVIKRILLNFIILLLYYFVGVGIECWIMWIGICLVCRVCIKF